MALWILSGTTQVSQYQKKHSLTHTHHGHQSSPYLLHPSITIHGILPVQFMCLTVFFHNVDKFSLVYLLAWHPPFHTPYISSPNHCLLFAAHVHTITTYYAKSVSEKTSFSSTRFGKVMDNSIHVHACMHACMHARTHTRTCFTGIWT